MILYSKPPTPPTSSFLPSYPRFLNTLRFCFTFFPPPLPSLFSPLSLSLHNSILFFPPPAHGPPPHFPSAGRRAGDFSSFGQKERFPPRPSLPTPAPSPTEYVFGPSPPPPLTPEREREEEGKKKFRLLNLIVLYPCG